MRLYTACDLIRKGVVVVRARCDCQGWLNPAIVTAARDTADARGTRLVDIVFRRYYAWSGCPRPHSRGTAARDAASGRPADRFNGFARPVDESSRTTFGPPSCRH